MPKISKQLSTIVIIFACVAFIFIIKSFISGKGFQFHSQGPRFKGNMNAKVKIKEYADFQCPACAEGAKVLHQFIEQYPNDINVELKFFPLSGHLHGFTSARYAFCAGEQRKFWEFQDLLFAKQSQWAGLGDVHPFFKGMAQELSMDTKKLNECLLDNNTDTEITREKEEGRVLGVQRTPTYFINEEMIVGAKSLKDKLETLLGPVPEESP